MHLTLTSLPLLQGVSATDLTRILEKTGYQFARHGKGEVLMEQGATCHQLCILMEGTLQVTTRYDEGRYTFTEYLATPDPIEPEILYGIRRQYASTYTAASDCLLLCIPKTDINRMISHIEVFRLNYLNLLSTLAVRRQEVNRPSHTQGLRGRIAHFLTLHAAQPSGPKHFRIRMADLGYYVGAARMAVAHALHQMEADGVLHCERESIEIPRMEDLND